MVFYFPALPQQSNITRREQEPEIPENVSRSTEILALRRIAARARISSRVGARTALPRLHLELIRLERACLQYLPHLDYDERMEFIAGAARMRNVSRRQITALLDQASDILMLRELSGLSTIIEDYDRAAIENMRRRNLPIAKRRPREKQLASLAA